MAKCKALMRLAVTGLSHKCKYSWDESVLFNIPLNTQLVISETSPSEQSTALVVMTTKNKETTQHMHLKCKKTIKLHRQYKQNHKSLFSGLLPHPGRKRSGPILTTLEHAWGKRECNLTNNETGRHRGPQQKLRSGHRASSWHRRAMCRHSYFCLLDIPISVMHVIFSSSSVVSCAFHALRAYSTFGHHPHPLGYPCAKLSFCRTLHCWASPWRNIAYSINHSITQSLSPSSFDGPGTEAFALE